MSMADEIQTIIDKCDIAVSRYAAEAQHRARLDMEAGSTVPDWGRFGVPSAAEDGKRAIIAGYRDEICDVIDKEAKRADATVSANVPADAAATVQVALSRKHIDPDELDALHQRYRGFYQLARLIEERAAQEHVMLSEPVGRVYADADAARYSASQGLYSRYSSHGSTSAPLAETIEDRFLHRDVFGNFYD